MVNNYLIEILLGVLKVFLHPFIYLYLFILYFGVVKRLKRERRQFHTRVFGGIADIFQTIFASIVIGLVFSILTIGIGIQFSLGVIALLGVSYLLFSLPFHFKWIHPVYVFTVSVLVVKFLPELNTGIGFLNQWLADIQKASIPSLALILGILLLQEGILIRVSGSRMTSPILLKSKRGQVVGGHEVRKLWLIPLFLFIPSGSISVVHGLPFLLDETGSYSLLLVPFAIGFQQMITHTLPEKAVRQIGNQTIMLSILVLAGTGAAIGFSIPILAFGMVIIAFLIHVFMQYKQNTKNINYSPFYTEKVNGAIVLGVLPHSPADKMGIKIGEIISKVNGKVIATHKDVYYAVQINAAFCKLEVIDIKGEPRIVQRSLYENEHHELGLLFVEQNKSIDDIA